MSAIHRFDPDLDPAEKVDVHGHYWLASQEPLPCPVPGDEFPQLSGNPQVCLIHSRCIECGDKGHFSGDVGDDPMESMVFALMVGGLPYRCPGCR